MAMTVQHVDSNRTTPEIKGKWNLLKNEKTQIPTLRIQGCMNKQVMTKHNENARDRREGGGEVASPSVCIDSRSVSPA